MRKEISSNRKILRSIVLGLAVYGGAYLLSLLVLTGFSEYIKYPEHSIGILSTFIAGVAAFLTIKSDEKILLLYNKKAVFANKPFFLIYVILLSFALTVVFNYLYSLIPWQMLGDKYVVQDNEAFYSIPLTLRIAGYVLIGPFSEEVLFRAVIFSRFDKLIPVWASVIVGALFFGIYHGNIMQGSYAFVMGAVMCLTLHYGGSLLYPLVFHMIANLISNLCFEFKSVNDTIYSLPVIIGCIAYLVVAIIMCYVFKVRLTKKDKEC